MRILIVEDDHSLLHALSTVLKEEQYQCDEANNGEDGLFLAEQDIHDVIVLDIMLPGMNGISIIKKLRERSVMTPILLLTAKDSVQDRVKGLDAGADDYLIKPFAMSELLARIRVLIRSQWGLGSEGYLKYGVLTLNPKHMDATVSKQSLKLSIKEYELLEFLIMNKEQILTREQVFDRVWGFNSEAGSGIVDLYIHYLRKKLTPFGCNGLIHTIRSIGYIMKEKS